MAQGMIIPKPVQMEILQADTVVIGAGTIIYSDASFFSDANLLSALLKKYTGYNIPVKKGISSGGKNDISLIRSKDTLNYPSEAYSVLADKKGITIIAGDGAGIYYGGITMLQLLTRDTSAGESFNLPSIAIRDQPRFKWRGLMLDCSRTLISVGHLKRTIDRMSFYKLNTLHLHLTDDQGWRLQIKQRPLLTTKGAFFADNYHEPKEFEGFYSQEQIKDIIRYASLRHIQIIPEIEAPGHSSAAIHAYPHLSCSERVVPIYPLLAGSPAPPNDVFCAGNEGTYQFFEDVLKETAGLFSSPFIHLGGDEVSKHHWKECNKCQAKIKSEKLKNEEELQRYLMNRVSKTVIDAGKRPIGWDEVMEGNIGKNWLIMAWRGEQKGMEAASLGYDVVMSPTTHLYFDYRHITTPTKKVYSYEPIPDTSLALTNKVLGIQANFWSHIERTESRIDFMLFPRSLALAERAWSERSVKDYEDFNKRKIHHFKWLKFFDVKFNGNDDPEPSPWDLVW